MKKAVITGATGAIGRALINTCINEGYDVLAVVHRSSSRAEALAEIEHCEVMKLDLSEYCCATDELEKQGISSEGCEIFLHLAWEAPFGEGRNDLRLQLNNIRYSLDAVHFAKALGCTTFAGTGSQAEYGRVEGMLSPDTPAFPETGYGIAKLCAGQMTRLACEQLGLKHIWTRVLSVYGPHDGANTLISTAVRCMMNDEETEFTPCEQMWDYIYSDDAARAILLAAQKGESGKVYVIGSGEVHPLKEYIEVIAEICRYSRPIGFGKRPYNDKQVMYLQADISDLRALGFSADNKFNEGIKKILDTFVQV